MKRISLFATLVVAAIVAIGAFASMSIAAPGSGAKAASIRAGSKTTITVTVDPEEYYGEATCTVTRTVSKKFPGGRDKEKCVSATTFTNMVAGPGQTKFKGVNAEGPFEVGGWNSDFDGKGASSFSYSVAKNLKSFKLTAVYPAPEPEPPAE
jgi:hypothetical protein